MFVVTVQFKIHPGREAAFLSRVSEQARDSLAREDDCLQFDVATPADRQDEVFLYEIYRDAAAFQAHLASAHFKAFDAAVADWVAQKSVATWVRVES